MNQLFSATELKAKGITKRDVQRLMKSSESRVSCYVKQFAANGCKCSASFQAAWDAECARWDHFKATLSAF